MLFLIVIGTVASLIRIYNQQLHNLVGPVAPLQQIITAANQSQGSNPAGSSLFALFTIQLHSIIRSFNISLHINLQNH